MTKKTNKQVPADVEQNEIREDRKKECDICHCKFTEWGNNPMPFIGEICCNDCNEKLVVPARIYIMMKAR